MKTIYIVLGVLLCSRLIAQDLSTFQVESHYDFTKSNQDIYGKNASADTSNIEHSIENGFYSNGIYRYDTIPGGSYIGIDSLPFLHGSDFAFQIEFNAEDLNYRTFLVIGQSWRNFVFSFQQDSLLELTIDGRSQTGTSRITNGQWYTLTVTHSRSDSITSFYINENLEGQLKQYVDIKSDDTGLINTHYGSGDAFKGWWKTIKLYRTRANSTLSHRIHELDLYPNPCTVNQAINIVNLSEHEINVLPLDGSKNFLLQSGGIQKRGCYLLRSMSRGKVYQEIIIVR